MLTNRYSYERQTIPSQGRGFIILLDKDDRELVKKDMPQELYDFHTKEFQRLLKTFSINDGDMDIEYELYSDEAGDLGGTITIDGVTKPMTEKQIQALMRHQKREKKILAIEQTIFILLALE